MTGQYLEPWNKDPETQLRQLLVRCWDHERTSDIGPAPRRPTVIAYVDESIRSRDRLYVVAAGLVGASDTAEVGEVLRRIPPGHSRRFHWRTEQEPSRLHMVDAIRDLKLHTFAACYRSDHTRWSKRGRIQALKSLLWKLREAYLSVDQLVIETRGEAGNKEDRRTIYRAQRSGHAEAALTYTFESSLNPLL